ncbi:hypothetical protein [Photobacterium sp. J15]|uniref:hypothetical protein n=1 Tax=Photobacterium sp. J15 TaxID=265901 RepID=UPI0007E42B6D|nr:hypothetical protein [Photobacterium sp. J15]
MSMCVVTDPQTNNLVLSTEVPCNGYLLVAETDIQNQITGTEVGLLFGAACSAYALQFVIKLALMQLGFKG